MKKKIKKTSKVISEKQLKDLIENNDEVRIVREITRLSKSTIKAPVPYHIDNANYYKV